MRIYEITEQRQQIDELAPLALPVIGTVTLSGILAGVSAILTAMDIANIYKLITKAGNDPKSMTEDDWIDLFISVLFMLPMLKYIPGKSKIASMLPDSWKRKGGEKVKDIVTKKESGSAVKKDEPKKAGAVKKTLAVGAGGAVGYTAGDALTGGNTADTIKSVAGSGTSTIGKALGIGGSSSADDMANDYSMWFGRTK